MSEQKIDRTFNKALEEVAKLEKAFKPGGKLDKAIMDMGGDPTALREAAETFKALSSGLTKAHFDALGQKEQLTEGVLDEDDEDGFMARSQLYFMAKDAIRLHSMIDDKDNLEPWVQSKIAQAAQAMDAVRRYTEYNAMKAQVEPEMEPAMEPEMESEITEQKEFGMFSPAGDAQVQNAIQYILNDFEDAAEKASSSSERDMLRMQAMQKLFDELEEMSEQGYEEATDTDVRERAAMYLDSGIVRIMDRIDDLDENMWGQGTLQYDAPHSQFMRSANADASRKRHMQGAKRKDRVAQKHAPKPGDFHSGVPSRSLVTRPTESKDVNEAEEKPYICVHAKKGKYECHAGSSYEAAKKAAAHWKMKSTAGIDAHLAVEETVNEGVEFDAAGQTAEFKAVAGDVIKNALAKAKSKVKS